jgi:tetratricopeptide (TPR) repeat protein
LWCCCIEDRRAAAAAEDRQFADITQAQCQPAMRPAFIARLGLSLTSPINGLVQQYAYVPGRRATGRASWELPNDRSELPARTGPRRDHETLCQGDARLQAGSLQAALDTYDRALALVPGDKTHWEASTWIFAAKGDAFFAARRWHAALECFRSALACPGGFGNPFIHLRLGQCCLEMGDDERAADELTRAYALEGDAIFAADGARYLAFLKTRILPTAQRRLS